MGTHEIKPLAISIICAVYNTEKYICRSVDSILKQTFVNFELLLIDSSSTDSSGRICDEYATQDSRVRVFHKENNGVASARQLGYDNVRGEFSIHVDSDDWIEPHMLETMYRIAVNEKADIVVADYYTNSQCGKQSYIEQQPPDKGIDFIHMILSGKLYGSLWNKLVRHKCISEYNLKFALGIDFCEDVIMCTQLLLRNPKIVYCNDAFYHYFQNDLGITRTIARKNVESLLQFISVMENLIDSDHKKIFLRNKFFTKRMALHSNLYSRDKLKNMFPEINQEMVKSDLGFDLGLLPRIELLLAALGFIRFVQDIRKLKYYFIHTLDNIKRKTKISIRRK